MLLFTTLELGPAPPKGTQFWSHFGDMVCQSNEKRRFQKCPQNQFRKTLKTSPKTGGGVIVTFGFFFLALDPPWSHFAAGTLLDLNASLFWLRFDPKIMFCRPRSHFFTKLSVVVSGCFLGRVHRAVQIVLEKIARVPHSLRMLF